MLIIPQQNRKKNQFVLGFLLGRKLPRLSLVEKVVVGAVAVTASLVKTCPKERNCEGEHWKFRGYPGVNTKRVGRKFLTLQVKFLLPLAPVQGMSRVIWQS